MLAGTCFQENPLAWSRSPAVAGTFYPGTPESLRADVERLLGGAAEARCSPGPERGTGPDYGESSLERRLPKAIIAPHAGYVYSGPVAASAYAAIAPFRESISRVILLGPAHRIPVRGLAACTAGAFETPLGPVPVDGEALQGILDFPQVQALDEAHSGEHSLEVHLPFLQVALGDFALVPLVVGEAFPEEVAEVLESLWGGPETLIVISSDLSHYLPYDHAKQLDLLTSRAIQNLRPEEIQYEQACGRIPVAGLLLRARVEGLSAECVDLRNSGDTAGPRTQVVGYGSFIFTTADTISG